MDEGQVSALRPNILAGRETTAPSSQQQIDLRDHHGQITGRRSDRILPTMTIEASCHCGAVRIEVDSAPDLLTTCNCSVCRRARIAVGVLLAESSADHGATLTYRWGDKMLDLHHCGTCGCTTHWTGIDPSVSDRMGVNTRMMDPAVVAGVRIKRVDGAAGTWAELTD